MCRAQSSERRWQAVPSVSSGPSCQWAHGSPGYTKETCDEESDAVDEVRRLKDESGKDMLISGSISIAQVLHRASLIDEYRLILCPVVLGRGRPLFEELDRSVRMTSTHVNRLERGAVSLVHVPAAT